MAESRAMRVEGRPIAAEMCRVAILKGRVTLRLNFRCKGYVSRQYLWAARWRNDYTTLPLEVFTQRNFVADFIRLKWNFIQKTKKSLFEPPFGKHRGNVTYALHL